MTKSSIHRSLLGASAALLGLGALAVSAQAQTVVAGFDNGLGGVMTIGDGGTVGSGYGSGPTFGTGEGLLTTFTANDGGGINGTAVDASGPTNSLESFLNTGAGFYNLDPANVGVDGSAFKFNVTATGSSLLSLDLNFLTNEPVGTGTAFNNDFVYLTIDDGTTLTGLVLNQVNGNAFVPSATQNFNLETGFSTRQILLDAGTYVIGLAVVDDNFAESPSGLLVDNVTLTAPVPEPGSMALLGLGAAGAGLAAVRRRRNAAAKTKAA